MYSFLLTAGLLFAPTPPVALPIAPPDIVKVSTAPNRVLLEERDGQRLNFDFAVQVTGRDTLQLANVEVSVYDHSGALVLRKFVDNNGFSPAVNSLSHSTFLPGSTSLVFNPFNRLPNDVEVTRLAYVFKFWNPKREAHEVRLEVMPERYQPQTSLTIPLSGRLLIWDGHDEHAHHRRLDFLHPVAQQFGIRSNFMRYAHDFVVVDEAGKMFSGDEKKNTSYFAFGKPVHTSAAGKVVAVYAAQPDNDNGEDHFNPGEMVGKDPLLLYGNYVVVDHGHGEFSLMGHLKQNSVVVKVGDAVKADQVLAQVGSSGSSYFPHLHYELRTGKDLNVEGLPAYFRRFQLVRGLRSQAIETGALDSGDIVRQVHKGEK